MSKQFNAADWYWRKADGTLFSSKRIATVPATDAAFVAWSADGTMPTAFPRDTAGQESLAELQAVLARDGMSASLEAYAAARRYAVETAGITVAGMAIRTDRDSQAMISGAFNLAQAKPEAKVLFKGANGFVPLDAAAIQIVATAVGEHVQACFAKEAEVAAAIGAGTVASKAAVDAAFAPLAG